MAIPERRGWQTSGVVGAEETHSLPGAALEDTDFLGTAGCGLAAASGQTIAAVEVLVVVGVLAGRGIESANTRRVVTRPAKMQVSGVGLALRTVTTEKSHVILLPHSYQILAISL